MSTALRTLVPLLSLFVSQSLCFQFTFPIPGKIDYKFAEGDLARVEWLPSENINQLALNCGLDLEIDSDTPAYTVFTSDITSGVQYQIPDTWTGSSNKYCMFCTGTFIKACSGIFLLEELVEGASPMVHAIDGSTPQVQTTIPISVTSSPTQNPTHAMIAPSISGLAVTDSKASHTEDLKTNTRTPGTSCTTQPASTAIQGRESFIISTMTLTIPILITQSGTGGIATAVCPYATGASSCILVDPNSTLLPSFNFPPVPESSAILQPDSGTSKLREFRSTFATVIGLFVWAFLLFGGLDFGGVTCIEWSLAFECLDDRITRK